jgi:rhamnosyl/mannosyltransferase
MPFWLKYLKADILHFQLPCPTAMLSYFLARPKGKIVVSYQSDIVRQKWAIGLYKPLLNKFLKRADYIIASSPNYIETSPFLRRYKDKTVVIPNGTDINKFYSSDPKEPVILFVGKLRYYKGLNYLIEAMQNIDARLNIIGTGSEELKLKKLTNKLGLNNRINFLGNIPENKLPLYYANCSIFVLPACERSEAFGIVQLEAMASSKPVISTKLGTGLDWVNQDGITGITVPPKDPNALASAINKLLGDENLRKTLGQNTRSKVEKEFSKDLMLKRIHELYIKILCPDI